VISETLIIFLIIWSYTLQYRNPGRATHSTNKKQGKSEKQILIGPRLSGNSNGSVGVQCETQKTYKGLKEGL
jgi:hypothetical protein